jgi:serine palmitoyltransferase
LEAILKRIKDADGKEPVKQRRFLIVEGLYQNYGDICPFDAIVALKNKYCFRLLLDDSFGFGTFGKRGRGVVDLFNVPIDEIDFYVANLENSIASIGGFCTGNSSLVDHQRLAGKGYCFSASSPPYISTAAIEALKIIESQPQLFTELESKIEFFTKALEGGSKKFVIASCKKSPIFHIKLADTTLDRKKSDVILQNIVDSLLNAGIAVVKSKYIGTELVVPPPSIRMTITVEHTEEDLKKAAQIIKSELNK